MAIDLAEALVNPVMFFEDVLRVQPTWQQLLALETILIDLYDPDPDHVPLRQLAIKSGAGIGKTKMLTGIALWFALQQPKTNIYIAAPTLRQVQEVFFSELRRTIAKAHPFLSEITTVTSRICRFYGDKEWNITGLSAAKSDNIQGLHGDYMKIMIDECAGMPPEIMEPLLATLTNKESYLVATGNPTNRTCDFYHFFHGSVSKDWNKLTFSSEESPIVDQKHVRRLEERFGRDSDQFRTRVLGEFPEMDATAIIDEYLLRESALMPDIWAAPDGHSHRYAIGIDIAGTGGDESVIVARRGGHVAAMQIFVKKEPESVIKAAFALQDKLGWPNEDLIYVFDATGMGHGRKEVFLRYEKPVHLFTFNGRPRRRKEFKDKITEAWFELQAQLKRKQIKIPYDKTLWHQLTTRQFEYMGDLLKVEKKDVWKKRLGIKNSSDRADALLLAFYPFTRLKVLTGSQEGYPGMPSLDNAALPDNPSRHLRRRRIRVNSR